MTQTIEEVRQLGAFLKGYQFQLVFPEVPVPAVQGQELAIRGQSSSLPGSSLEVSEATLHAQTVRESGRRIFSGTWTVNFLEGTSMRIIRAMSQWKDLCFDPTTGAQDDPDNYKRNARVELFDNGGNVQLVRAIFGIWPQDVPDLGLDGSDSNPVPIPVTFAFDYWRDR